MWPTIIIASLIAIAFVAIIANEIKKKKSGKGCCGSCGGNCGACSLHCRTGKEE